MFAVISGLLLLSSVAAFAPQGKRHTLKLFFTDEDMIHHN